MEEVVEEEEDIYQEYIPGEFFEVRRIIDPQFSIEELGAITAITFDPFEEVLWTGTESVNPKFFPFTKIKRKKKKKKLKKELKTSQGRVSTWTSPSMNKYISVACHTTAVRQLLVAESGFLSLAFDGIRYFKRGGVPQVTYMYTHSPFFLFSFFLQMRKESSLTLLQQ
jgi:hypothetical protein